MSPVGPMGLAWTRRGVCRLVMGHRNVDETADELRASCPGLPGVGKLPSPLAETRDRIKGLLRGRPDDLRDIPVDLSDSSEFSRKVLRALRKVKPGQVITYGRLAAKAGKPGAARAIGRIMGANPVPIIVPCHRCLGADGSLTGFSSAGGTGLKARLLFIEGYEPDAEHARGIRHLRKVDPKIRRVIAKVGPYLARPDKPRPPYDTLVTAIVHQQLSVKAGQTIAGRVRDLTPGPHFPSPAEMLEFPPEKLRACGLSNAKVGFVRDLAARVGDGRLKLGALKRMTDEEVITELTKVKGIGVWSAHMHLIFHMDRLDVLPVGDLGLRMAAAKLYGLEEYATPAELTEIAEPWRPFRSMGSYYLWRALDSGGI
ncbi:MAG: methylated-DNA--[protein]-cysteine S-methyltransferase [Candidatus Krumholzibacteriota bacterium]